jgi:hypothetical protein
MVMFCVCCGAAVQFELPDWSPAIEQVPAVTIVTVEPLTVQTPVVRLEKVTGKVEVAVALTLNVPRGE